MDSILKAYLSKFASCKSLLKSILIMFFPVSMSANPTKEFVNAYLKLTDVLSNIIHHG